MIIGFERETHELTTQELHEQLPLLVRGYMTKIGKKSAASNKYVREALKNKFGISIPDARFRKLINYIRTQGLVTCLIADNNGYYRAESIEELSEYTNGLRARANEILEVANLLDQQAKTLK